ncbi:Crp/Fnr family transcriptional regulator [Bradyrhizobium sp. CW4]|uniref:Crp/Fnr family transcriptional regulator n=1 Tax=Bradyrhizobium sp. CW4 TaxID=2782687 RepID=UPI001FF8D6DD|nr:Crp/Fnr family transcriptional regulator [Bradyrhizobium sp. CW4]MCK1413282.1 Crp/Fnr family transcriptional regulator [Bradyrhizobium sp. CW4]
MLDRPTNVHLNTRPSVSNAILGRTSVQELAAIGPLLDPMILRERMVLEQPKRNLDYIYFIESGLISLRIIAEGNIVETAMIGHRGAVGASFLFGEHLSTYQSVVVLPGRAYRVRVDDLRRVMSDCPEIREHLSQYVQALTLQCAQTALCGVRHEREKRLASWLCLASDAIDAYVLPVTHDYLSSVLALRRASVTETLIRFEEQGLIRKTRGLLRIDQRKHLEHKACCCYKFISSAYVSSESQQTIGILTESRM